MIGKVILVGMTLALGSPQVTATRFTCLLEGDAARVGQEIVSGRGTEAIHAVADPLVEAGRCALEDDARLYVKVQEVQRVGLLSIWEIYPLGSPGARHRYAIDVREDASE